MQCVLLAVAYRSDTGRIIKYEDTDDGFLRLAMRFRKLGDLRYLQLDGTERVEQVTADELYNRKSLRTASLKPITYNHPEGGMVTPENARSLQRGMTGTTIIRDDPYAVIIGAVFDAEMIDAIKSRELPDVSSGYWSKTINQDGKWLQSEVRYNHFAGCKYGRAGPDVGFLGFKSDAIEDKDIAVQLIDSSELDPDRPIVWTPYNFDHFDTRPKQSLTTMISELRIDDKTTIKIGTSDGEQAIARYLRDALDANHNFTGQLAAAKTSVDKVGSLESQVQTISAERDREKARADIAESKLAEEKTDDAAIKVAFDQGYQRHLLETTAVKFLPTETKIDSAMSSKDIKLAVIRTQLKLKADSDDAKQYDSQSEAYIDAAYDLLIKQDSSTGLRTAINSPERHDARMNSKQSPGERMAEKARERANKKLSLSTAN